MHQDSTFYFLKKKTFVSIVRKKKSKSWKPKRKETNVGHSRKAPPPTPATYAARKSHKQLTSKGE